MAVLMPLPKVFFTNGSGKPLVEGKVYSYQAGTNTPKATYTNAQGNVANTNPVILDSRGEASIWLIGGPYKIVLKDAAGATIWTQDFIQGEIDAQSLKTIAELRATTGYTTGDVAFVTSYYSGWAALAAGPVGGGQFVWDAASTAADNGGTIFAVTGVTTGRWKRTDAEFSFLNFGAVGNGIADDLVPARATIAACPVGGVVTVNDGYRFKISNDLDCNKSMTLTGRGELLMEGAATSGFLLKATAPGVVMDGLRAIHSTSGNQNNRFCAAYSSDFIMTGCYADNFAAGVSVRFELGEHFRSTIIGNQILNVRGFGLGPASNDPIGEADGDGITTWGAMATIANNIVSCKPGFDARIGIHCEGLAPNSPTQPFHSEALFSVVGNVVCGQFRRGISFEDIECGAILGNAVADSTWWLLSLNSCRNSVCAGNTGSYTRQAGQNQGSFYTPVRAAMMGYGQNEGCSFIGNKIRIENSAECPAVFYLQGTSGRIPFQTHYYDNEYTIESGTVAKVYQLEFAGTQCDFSRNTGTGFTNIGILMQNCSEPNVDGNRISALAGTASAGARFEACSQVNFNYNRIKNITAGNGRAVECTFNDGHSINDNKITNCLVGVDLFGAASSFVTRNTFKTVTTPLNNIAGSCVATPNIVIA